MRRRLLLIAMVLFVLWSCRPASYEQFIRASQAVDGAYVFGLDMSDTAATYDISFYTRVDSGLMAADSPSSQLALSVEWFAPAASASGLQSAGDAADSLAVGVSDGAASGVLSETVYLPCGDASGSVRLYRSGVRPEPCGEWRIAVRPVGAASGLRGIGIICKRKDDGTR